MIDDLSRTLRAILSEQVLNEGDDPLKRAALERRGALPRELATAHVVFDDPSEASKRQQTTVDLFLYDIRENVELRSNEPTVRRNGGRVITSAPPLRMACSYLVTAWPVGGPERALQEHQLLSQVLQVFSRLPTIPDWFLKGALKGQKPPLPMITALVDPQKNLSEFWTAVGSQLRPSLTVTATVGFDLSEPEMTSMVIQKDLWLGHDLDLAKQLKPGSTEAENPNMERHISIGGRVTGAANEPVPNATVCVVELGQTTRTNEQGRFVFDRIAPSQSQDEPGRFTLRVRCGGETKTLPILVPARRPPGEGLASYDIQIG